MINILLLVLLKSLLWPCLYRYDSLASPVSVVAVAAVAGAWAATAVDGNAAPLPRSSETIIAMIIATAACAVVAAVAAEAAIKGSGGGRRRGRMRAD